MLEPLRNRIWVDGVELSSIVSGDVSLAHQELRTAIGEAPVWWEFGYPGGAYIVHITSSTGVIVDYVDN
jgi:hypothetical protein